MIENTNKAIAINSAILYGKMAINIVCGLFATRFALQALGVADFGLFTVLGSIISFIAIFNTIMLSTSNRFIAVAIGRGNMDEVNKQFNVNLIIHAGIAVFALLVALPVGMWYIPRFVNYDGEISNALMVFIISILGSIISFVGVPFNGLLMAKEKFLVFSLVDVIAHVLRLIVTWLLIYYFTNKLLIYTITMAFLAAAPTFVYAVYCCRHYPTMVHLRWVNDRNMFKQVFGFSAWVAFGAVAQVAKDQGAGLVVNAFFNTVMNTAMGIALSLRQYVSLFAQNITQPMAPQITKSFVSGNSDRTDELLMMSTKYSFLLILLIGSIFLVEPEWILKLWLGDVPPYASIFLILFIVDSLVTSVNSGVSNIIWASGKIGLYQILVSTLNILSIVAGYFVLRGGREAYYLVVTYIVFSAIKFFAIQWTLHHTLNYDNRKLWKNSYLPSLFVVVLFLPVFILPDLGHPIINIVVSFSYLCVLLWRIGLSRNERKRLYEFTGRLYNKKYNVNRVA